MHVWCFSFRRTGRRRQPERDVFRAELGARPSGERFLRPLKLRSDGLDARPVRLLSSRNVNCINDFYGIVAAAPPVEGPWTGSTTRTANVKDEDSAAPAAVWGKPMTR